MLSEANALYQFHLLYFYCKSAFNPSNAKATFIQSTRMQKIFEIHLNPVMLVFIGKLSLSTLR